MCHFFPFYSRQWHHCSLGLDEIHFLLSTSPCLSPLYLIDLLLSLWAHVRIYSRRFLYSLVWLYVHLMHLLLLNFLPHRVILFFKLICLFNASSLEELIRWTTEHFSGIPLIVAIQIKQTSSFSLSVEAIISPRVHQIQRPIFLPLHYAA